jgi:hypothetical protein
LTRIPPGGIIYLRGVLVCPLNLKEEVRYAYQCSAN